MKDNYTYPVVFDYNEDQFINIIFPDFDSAVTYAEIDDDAIAIAQDFLSLTITDYEDDNKTLPQPSADIKIKDGQKLIYINIWMPYHKSKIKEIFVKKTLTIPSWLDILAKNNDINFSATLVKALKMELNIK